MLDLVDRMHKTNIRRMCTCHDIFPRIKLTTKTFVCLLILHLPFYVEKWNVILIYFLISYIFHLIRVITCFLIYFMQIEWNVTIYYERWNGSFTYSINCLSMVITFIKLRKKLYNNFLVSCLLYNFKWNKLEAWEKMYLNLVWLLIGR